MNRFICVNQVFHCSKRFYSAASLNDVVIIGAARTPMGGFRGGLKSLSAPRLGAVNIFYVYFHMYILNLKLVLLC